MNRSNPVRVALLAASILGISLLHYLTPLHRPVLHDIFQRLYYIPIIFAAFWFGIRGGLLSSIVVSILYAPHILFQWGVGGPSLEMEKFLEIILYNVVGGTIGYLSQKERERREQLEQTAHGLEESYSKLQSQADLIIGIEEQLRKAERLSVLGELSAVLAHEVRNPLGSIRGAVEILKDDYLPGDRKFEFLEIVIKETDRLNRVVEEFLQLSRPEQVERDTCDLRKELDFVISLVSGEAAKSGVRLVMESEGLPPVRGDREKLRQVFLNLVLNGIQATPRGGRIAICTEVRAADAVFPASVTISFTDTGTGMSREVLAHIFEPFYTTKKSGTGLGLAIAQKIVESHGGKIDAASSPGTGTTFSVRLPV